MDWSLLSQAWEATWEFITSIPKAMFSVLTAALGLIIPTHGIYARVRFHPSAQLNRAGDATSRAAMFR